MVWIGWTFTSSPSICGYLFSGTRSNQQCDRLKEKFGTQVYWCFKSIIFISKTLKITFVHVTRWKYCLSMVEVEFVCRNCWKSETRRSEHPAFTNRWHAFRFINDESLTDRYVEKYRLLLYIPSCVWNANFLIVSNSLVSSLLAPAIHRYFWGILLLLLGISAQFVVIFFVKFRLFVV